MTAADDLEQHLSAETVAALRAMTEHGDDELDAAAPKEPPGAYNPPGELLHVASADTRNDADTASPSDRRIIRPTAFTWRAPSEIPPRRWLFGRHYVRKFVSATIAPPGVGKSTLSLAEAVAMASARDFLGPKPCAALRVWCFNGEDPRDELERRIAAICLRHGVEPREIGDRLFLDSGRETEIILGAMERTGAVIAQPVVDAVKAAINDNGIDVLILDPFVSTHRVSENDNGAIDAIAKTWAKIADETDCAVELVHHSRKLGGAEVSAEDARGASSFIGAVRAARVINTMSESEALKVGIQNRREFFRVDGAKANLAPPEASHWFQLVSEPLGNGHDGPGDFVGVVTPWQWPDAFEGLSTPDLRKVQARIAEGEWAESVLAKNWAGKAVAGVLGLDLDDEAQKARIKFLLKTWIRNGALRVEERHNARTGRPQPIIVPGAPV
ncbi:MAG: AAA family ATPase [Methylocystis sp.]